MFISRMRRKKRKATDFLSSNEDRGEGKLSFSEVEKKTSDLSPCENKGEEKDFFELTPDEIKLHKAARPASIEAQSQALSRHINKKKTIALAFIFILIFLFVILSLLLHSSKENRIPDLRGMSLSAGMDEARAFGFVPRVIFWEYSNKHTFGTILSQEPGAGKIAEKGTEIRLTVSKGPRKEPELPDFSLSSKEQAENGSTPVAGKTVCIDPGHQIPPAEDEWADPGMTKRNAGEPGVNGILSGNPEHLLALDIAMKLKTLLEKDGVNVVLTRDSGDVNRTNIMRAEIASNADANLLVSIHFNFTEDTRESGCATLYPARNRWTDAIYEKSKTAALYVQEELVKSLDAKDVGVFARNEMTLFNWSSVPVIQVLPAYLSNQEEDEKLTHDDYRWKVAWGLRNGIIRYLQNP